MKKETPRSPFVLPLSFYSLSRTMHPVCHLVCTFAVTSNHSLLLIAPNRTSFSSNWEALAFSTRHSITRQSLWIAVTDEQVYQLSVLTFSNVRFVRNRSTTSQSINYDGSHWDFSSSRSDIDKRHGPISSSRSAIHPAWPVRRSRRAGNFEIGGWRSWRERAVVRLAHWRLGFVVVVWSVGWGEACVCIGLPRLIYSHWVDQAQFVRSWAAISAFWHALSIPLCSFHQANPRRRR